MGNRVDMIDWDDAGVTLDTVGWAVLPNLLSPEESDALAGLYTAPDGFRSRVVMARHGYGQGEYRYFAYPLPQQVAALRCDLYPHLAPIANRWHERLGLPGRFPSQHAPFLERCHSAGQTKPTPLRAGRL